MTRQDTTGDSRRSFLAKSALTTGTLALGTGAFGTATVGAQQERVAVFANNYYPGATFDVIDRIETGTTVDILMAEGDTVPEISQPDEWVGHIIRYQIGTAESGITTFLFAQGESLDAGDSGTIGEDASVLSSRLNLLSTSLGSGSDGGGVVDDDDGEADGDDSMDNVSDEDGGSGTLDEDDVTIRTGGDE